MTTTLRLFRQDPALPVLLRVTPVAVVAGLVLRMEPSLLGHLDEVASGRPPGGFAPLVMVLEVIPIVG